LLLLLLLLLLCCCGGPAAAGEMHAHRMRLRARGVSPGVPGTLCSCAEPSASHRCCYKLE